MPIALRANSEEAAYDDLCGQLEESSTQGAGEGTGRWLMVQWTSPDGTGPGSSGRPYIEDGGRIFCGVQFLVVEKMEGVSHLRPSGSSTRAIGWKGRPKRLLNLVHDLPLYFHSLASLPHSLLPGHWPRCRSIPAGARA